MIYKNDEPYKLTKEDLKATYDFLGWDHKNGTLANAKKVRPAVVMFTDSMYTYDKYNKRKVRPPMVNLPMEAMSFEDTGSVKWNYSERPVQKEKETGALKYNKYFSITGTFSLGPDKIDLLFFLVTKSNLRELTETEIKNGTREQINRPVFKIENKEAEAKLKLEKKRIQNEIESYINGQPGVIWETEKVRRYAVVYGIDDAMNMGESEVRAALLGRLEGEAGGWNRFYALCNVQEETNQRYQIEMCKKNGTIKYFDKSRKWHWMNGNDKGSEICSMTSAYTTPEEALLQAMQVDQEIAEGIRSSVDYEIPS